MKLIDPYSYQCGIIDSFQRNDPGWFEKRIALSHPTASVRRKRCPDPLFPGNLPEIRDLFLRRKRTVTNRSFSSFTKPRDLPYRLLEKRRRLERIFSA